ncbi:DUF6415 family natural product biosynthesis protein [Streptomyces sp. WMMC940]|uniref:DUF6415 family natural product biosynthesis protein n=1 Tax=Streptomyces sp. WMMC940 TaxID=3015153 RepID=UPI0022B6BDC6|nr:DUF6415 family natural product biosynthesis protein [Streptomyces sp. WMMC940]MCZ7462041.1 DUF6415 family natural product biosynthesis protein [Streptomyces sp. WMMC940]
MKHGTAPAEPSSGNDENRPPDLATMRETGRLVMAMGEPGPELEDLTAEMRGFVQLLVPEIRALIAAKPAGDQPAQVAQVGVDEAWRRLHTTPGFGPDAAYRRAQKLALSVFSLCDHYENLQPPAAAAS